jgi:predicted AlkP superfamily phosphohydrolase/phosphomutase
MSKVIEIGLEGLSFDLINRWAEDLPTLAGIMQEGIRGNMRSAVPPVSAVSWASAQTSRNPGVFGFWDSTYRAEFSYATTKRAGPESLKVKPLYTLLPLKDKKIALVGLPLTSPPPRIPGGYVVSDSGSSDAAAGFTWPKSLKAEVTEMAGEYIFDVAPADGDYEGIDREQALPLLRKMDSQRFSLLKHFVSKKQCDYVIAVILGLDRVSRLFYRFFDSNHRKHVKHTGYYHLIRDHYQFIDKELEKIRDMMDEDTVLFAHSTFGIQRLDGRILLNEWLIGEGYMVLHQYPSQASQLKDLKIDWSRTKAWAPGYNGALYLNMKGRESEGVVDPSNHAALLDELAQKLGKMTDENGAPLKPAIFPGRETQQGPLSQYGPDLFVHFNDGHWGTSEKVGSKSLYDSNFTSPQGDVANILTGFFALAGPGVPAMAEEMQGVSVLDVAPTVLSIMKETVPEDFEGKSLIETVKKREQAVRDRLAFLGY